MAQERGHRVRDRQQPRPLQGLPPLRFAALWATAALALAFALPAATASGLEPEHTVTIEKIGTGTGTVTSLPGSIDCGSTCSDQFPDGTRVTLVATPDAGSAFDHFSGGNCAGSGPCEKPITTSRTIRAVFSATGTRTLTVAKTGTGAGTVTSKPAGIACGAVCSAPIAAYAKATLRATPAEGSLFAGFSGACTGTKPCRLTMSEARSVTAAFAKAPPPVPGTLVVAKAAKVKGQRAFLRAHCAGPTSCRGSLKLTAKFKGKVKPIGAATFSLAPGATTKLKIKLSPRAKQALKASGRLKARVSGTGIAAHAVSLRG